MPFPAKPLRTLTACLLAGTLLAGCLYGKSPQPPPRIPKPKSSPSGSVSLRLARAPSAALRDRSSPSP